MKQRIAAVCAVCFAISTLVFASLWTAEKNSKDDLRELAQAEARDAYMGFAIYQDRGDVRRYWDGVASFRAFQDAYRSIFQGTSSISNYLICDNVYGYLIGAPEKSQAHIADLVEIMELLYGDIEDLNGHAKMLNLRDALSAEE